MRDALERARSAFDRRDWAAAYDGLSAANAAGEATDAGDAAEARAGPAVDDLERLAVAAYMLGRDEESERAWGRAYRRALGQGNVPRAARCAFWLGFGLVGRGERARAGGWFARAGRALEEGGGDCVERGYLLLPAALRQIGEADEAGALATFREAAAIATRFDDPDLLAYARHGEGRVLIRTGETAAGIALLDEVMVAVTAGELSPIFAGDVYCSMIEACHEVFDLRRAQEWTAALDAWCEAQPGLVAYRGQCLVRRAEIMCIQGEWPDALDEARRASERLTRPPGRAAAGAAFYQQAEIHRLRGEFDAAEDAYRRASDWGRKPQPGLALLRLAQGRLDAAEAAIRRVVDEATTPRARSRVLGAQVEILLATGDAPAARAAADELSEIAESLDSPVLRATAARARGAVLLDAGDARAALAALRTAETAWREIGAPYEAARVRVLIGLACRRLGDRDTAALELAAARTGFEQLGAGPDLDRVTELASTPSGRSPGGLTPREIEVLRLVATGRTNRAVAESLFISEKTVARHLSNIFRKLRISSRSAATAFAYEHELV